MILEVGDLTQEDLKDILYFIHKAKPRRVFDDETPRGWGMESDRDYMDHNRDIVVKFLDLAEEIKKRKETE